MQKETIQKITVKLVEYFPFLLENISDPTIQAYITGSVGDDQDHCPNCDKKQKVDMSYCAATVRCCMVCSVKLICVQYEMETSLNFFDQFFVDQERYSEETQIKLSEKIIETLANLFSFLPLLLENLSETSIRNFICDIKEGTCNRCENQQIVQLKQNSSSDPYASCAFCILTLFRQQYIQQWEEDALDQLESLLRLTPEPLSISAQYSEIMDRDKQLFKIALQGIMHSPTNTSMTQWKEYIKEKRNQINYMDLLTLINTEAKKSKKIHADRIQLIVRLLLSYTVID